MCKPGFGFLKPLGPLYLLLGETFGSPFPPSCYSRAASSKAPTGRGAPRPHYRVFFLATVGLSIRGQPLNTGNPLFAGAVALRSPTPLASEDALGRYDSQLQPKSAIPIRTLISISDLAEDSGDRCVVSWVFWADFYSFFVFVKQKAYSGAVSSNPFTSDLCVNQAPDA